MSWWMSPGEDGRLTKDLHTLHCRSSRAAAVTYKILCNLAHSQGHTSNQTTPARGLGTCLHTYPHTPQSLLIGLQES